MRLADLGPLPLTLIASRVVTVRRIPQSMALLHPLARQAARTRPGHYPSESKSLFNFS